MREGTESVQQHVWHIIMLNKCSFYYLWMKGLGQPWLLWATDQDGGHSTLT